MVDEAAKAEQQPASPLLRPEPATTLVVAAISLVGVLLTGLCLVTADRLDQSTPAQILAVLAVGAALTSVMVAVAGHLWTTLPPRSSDGAASRRTRHGIRVTVGAAALSMVAIVLAGAAALVVVLRDEHVGLPDEQKTHAAPAVTLQLTGAPGAMALSVQLSVPGLPAGGVVDTKLIGVSQEHTDDEERQSTRLLLARSLVPAGTDGLAVAQLAAPVQNYQSVVIEATMPDRTCTQTLPLDDVDAAASPLACTPN